MNKADYGRKMNELTELSEIIMKNRAEDLDYGVDEYIGFLRAMEIIRYLVEGGQGEVQEMIMQESLDLEAENEELIKENQRLRENEERMRKELLAAK